MIPSDQRRLATVPQLEDGWLFKSKTAPAAQKLDMLVPIAATRRVDSCRTKRLATGRT
jgi:hypothetical protein